MTLQDNLIGKHPLNELGSWLKAEDLRCSDLKRHRYLEVDSSFHTEAIELISKWLLQYHLSEGKQKMIERKQKILEKYDFKEFAKKLHVFPESDKTRKGNFGEVILSEYLSLTSGVEILIYKLHYNPNIDQSMKGDDVLLVDDKTILLGESKFRSQPSKSAVEEAAEGMGDKLTLPLSLTFIADRLFDQGNIELGEMIFNIHLEMGKKDDMDIKNIGFLLSTKNVRNIVERNLSAKNSNFIFISLGIENPVTFLEEAFARAENLLRGGLDEA